MLTWARGRAVGTVITFALLSGFLVACTESIEILIRGCRVENEEPTGGAVLPYSRTVPNSLAQNAEPGPFITVIFSAPADLETLGRNTHIHHLYYNVFACSSVPLDARLCTGDVYRDKTDEIEPALGRNSAAAENLYKVYIPRSLQRIGKRAEVFRDLNVPAELENLRSTGMCMIIGGANMLGTGFWSKPVRVPVMVIDDFLEVNLRPGESTVAPDGSENHEE